MKPEISSLVCFFFFINQEIGNNAAEGPQSSVNEKTFLSFFL